MDGKVVRLQSGQIRLIENGIIHGTITKKGVIHQLEDAEEITRGIQELADGEGPCVMLIDVTNLKFVDKKAIHHFASKEHTDLIKAQALVVGSVISHVISRFFLRLYEPPYPIRIFTSQHEALSWLRGFITKVEDGPNPS